MKEAICTNHFIHISERNSTLEKARRRGEDIIKIDI
jgi:hypothetical protein